MKRSKAIQLVGGIVTQRNSATDATASATLALYPGMNYAGELITAGTRIRWGGGLKRAAVDLWDTEQNNPDNAPTLWEDVAYYMGHRVIPENITSTLAFSAGEIGYWPKNGKFYRAINNGTTWTPEAHPPAWEEVTDA